MRQLFFLLITIFAFSCQEKHCNPCLEYMCMGQDDFTGESDLIAMEGKFGIAELEGTVFEDLPEDALLPYIDKIAEDDLLNVVLFHPTRRDMMDSVAEVCHRLGGFRVHDGKVSIPDFPPMQVAGLTLDEARRQMTAQLQQEVGATEVFVSFKERPSHKVELMGLVSRDSIEVDGRVRLYEVLAKAHLQPQANLHASYLLREGVPLKVDMSRLVKEGDMSQNIVMRARDKIYIGSAGEKTALIMGEVRTPRTVPLVDGTLSLREALALANGIPHSGDEKHIQIIRANTLCPKIFVLSMKCVLHEPNRRLLLIPGDVVYVTRTPITNWNLFLNDVWPTLQTIIAAETIYNLSR